MNFYLEALQDEHRLLEQALESYREPVKRTGGKIRNLFRSGKANKIIFAGMGSSWYAARSILPLLNENGYFSIAVNCFEMGTTMPGMADEMTVLVLITQSGNTPEVVELLERTKDRVAATVSLINEESCAIKGLVQEELYLKIGHETPISNKTYYAQVALLNLLAGEITGQNADDTEQQIRKAVQWHQEYCGCQTEKTERLLQFLEGTELLELLGDGPQGGAAQQAGLVLREMTDLKAVYYSSSDYSHGWFDIAKSGYTAVFLCRSASGLDRKMITYCLGHGAKVLFIGSKSVEMEHENLMEVLLPECSEGILPLYSIVPFYFIAGIWPERKNKR